jgi:hypothetical protein
MNRALHSGAIALACLGVVLIFVGWAGLRAPSDIHCGDETCEEAHP